MAAMPDGLPPWRTVYCWFARLRDGGIWETINHHVVMRDREWVGREASPTAAVIDSQSVKTTESSGVRGYDGGNDITPASAARADRAERSSRGAGVSDRFLSSVQLVAGTGYRRSHHLTVFI